MNTPYLGYRVATGGNSAPVGTINVNGTATLVVNNAICLSFNGGGSGFYASGTLNINGGTVLANTITNGVSAGANSTANILMTGGTLGITSLLGSVGTMASPLKTITLAGSTLQLPVSGLQTNVVVSTLNDNSGNTFPGGVTVNAGTVQFGNGGTSGNLPTTESVLDNGNLVFN